MAARCLLVMLFSLFSLSLPALLPAQSHAQASTVYAGENPQLGDGESLVLTVARDQQACRAHFLDHEFPIIPHPGDSSRALIVLAAPLDTPPGLYPLKVHCPDTSATKDLNTPTTSPDSSLRVIKVQRRNYPAETLTLNPAMVTPPDDVIPRIKRERVQIRAALLQTTEQLLMTSSFQLPVPKRKVTSEFGTGRIYNNQLKSRHTGLDLRAAVGTPVCAPGDGRVRMAQDNWHTGGHIIIDHGHGISSSYFHLSQLQVRVGDRIKCGQQFALTGATGRVTGPHLHWGIHIQGDSR